MLIERNPPVNADKAKKNLTEDENIIQAFMNERDLPEWYRGLSKFQLDAADALLNNIRDDSEQGTSHRVRDSLIKLGIEPLVSNSKIKLAMRLSRGNDMAFLYFLMEMYYRNACVECEHESALGYTVNEQVFMTSIAHLDTIPTLREMDKLLPQQPPKPKKKRVPRKKISKIMYPLPYFQSQHRPVEYGKKLTLEEVDNVANLCDYDNYLNPNYVVPNERNRWYANYKLKTKERIATRIIKDQIKNIFEREDAGTLHDGKRDPIFCAHHMTMGLIKEAMANELKVLKKKACEKYFDVEGRLKDESYKRVVEMLDMEISKAEEYITKIYDDSLKKKQMLQCQQTNEEDRRKSNTDSKAGFNKNRFSIHSIHSINDHSYDYGHAYSPIAKNNFFQGPSDNKPYKFNYEKIFDLGVTNPVKDAVSKALKNCSSGDMSVDHDRAVQQCCKDIWTEEVKAYNKLWTEKERELRKQPPPPKETNLGFDLPYYNPRNKKLMESMLYKAIQEMRKNKKFVLASLPDAHKIPILKEFIRKRYGMVYTRKEKREAFKLSKRVFHVLQRDEIRIKIPQIHDVSKKRYVSYGYKNYILRKTNFLKERYHHNFKVTLLEAARIYWGAVRPYQCPKGPPRNEFFSYLPSRENDVHMFRPWQVGEFIRAKEEWDRKQTIKRMALRY